MAPADLEFVKYEKRGHIAYVTINRPEVLNALHTFTHAELRKCWRDIQLDPDIYVGIVTGEGRAFCAGRDVKFLSEYQQQGKRTPHEDPSSPYYFFGGGGKPNDVGVDKPLIAAINGLAVGVGLNIILQCQLRVMADDAWLGDQHTNVGRVGAPEELYTALPRTTAAYLTLCNGRLTAQECLNQAIVNKVVPRHELLDAATELAEMVCQNAPLAVQAAVRSYRLTSSFSPEMKEYMLELDRVIGETDDCIEGALAFSEKRRPVWVGH
jgi:enoyl-CoA hydratase/carnithine racemase